MVQKMEGQPCPTQRASYFSYIAGFSLFNSAYVSVLNLQSSINVVNGLGTATLAVTYASCNLFLIFFTPILLRKLGPKICLILSEFTYLLYVLANIHPMYFTLIPAGFVVGIGEALMWPSVTLLNYHYATVHANRRNHPTNQNHFYVNLYSGYFFTVVQACQVFGNGISYVVLYGLRNSITENMPNNTSSYNASYSENYEYCGSKDCQDKDLVAESINQYVPTNKLALYVLLAILSTMCIGSQILHWCFLPTKLVGENNTKPYHSDQNNPMSSMLGQYEAPQDAFKETVKSASFWTSYVQALKDIVLQMGDVRQLLIVPLSVYVGFYQAFIFSELTRAYASCVLGVATIGINMAIYGISDAIFSFIYGKFGESFGRTPFVILSVIFDCSTFTYCLLWQPSQNFSWTIYLLFFFFGCSDGIWQTLVNALYLDYFASQRDVASTVWILCVTIGFTIQFAWSSALCVRTKIYVQYLLLAFAISGYVFAEWLHRKSNSRKNNNAVQVQSSSLE